MSNARGYALAGEPQDACDELGRALLTFSYLMALALKKSDVYSALSVALES